MKTTTNYQKNKFYTLENALKILQKEKQPKFNASIDLAIKLNINPKKQDQHLRGVMEMPYFFGKKKKILVLDKNLTEKDAKRFGVEYCGGSEMINKIQQGWLDFNLIITTPRMMLEISKLGKILGTKGLMPNPKNGNVTDDLEKAIVKFQKGVVQFRSDSGGNINLLIGKINAQFEAIKANFEYVLDFINAKKPAVIKGEYIKAIHLSSTMGSGVKILWNKAASVKSKKIVQRSKTKDKKTTKNVYLHPRYKYLRKNKC